MAEARSQHTVMVVDDDPSVGDLFRKVFREEGYDVLVAQSGPECLGLSEAHPPDVVILDLVMPIMDGLATLRALRERGQRPVVVILTARGSIETAREAMELGAYEYVTKPFNVEFLKGVMREGLAMRSETARS